MDLLNAVYDFVAGPVLGSHGPVAAGLLAIALVLGVVAMVWGVLMLIVAVVMLALSVSGFCFIGAVYALEAVGSVFAARAKRRA
ncbi:hypothetical protein [Comamonas sp. HJ-2]|jgi:hypothetical protein